MRTGTLALGAISALCAVVSSGPSSAASLTGSSVSGQLFDLGVTGVPDNLFDPSRGFVPPIYGNFPNGPNNVIIDSVFGDVEFGFNNAIDVVSADFTGNSVTVEDDVLFTRVIDSITLEFTDALFAGATVTLGTDNFPSPFTETLVGDVLTLSTPSSAGTRGQVFDATFNITPVSATPLPAALPLFATGLGALGLLGWRRKRKAQVSPSMILRADEVIE